MTVGVGILVMVIPEAYRLGHGGTGFVGGQRGLSRGSIVLGFIGSIAAMIIGSSAGTGDLSTGIFRDLVATGRSRWSLFAARIPGALAFWVPLMTGAYLVTALLDVWFSRHSHPTCPGGPAASACQFFSGSVPPFSQFVTWYLWVMLYTCFVLLVAIGLASLVGSRAITLGVLIPFQLFVAPVLSAVRQLGALREAFYTESIGLIAPNYDPSLGARHAFGQVVTSSLAIAWLVLAAWAVILLGAGMWRTVNRDC
jgi:ABC-type transport system involved in multi-copper enzyme maturation permease subunit